MSTSTKPRTSTPTPPRRGPWWSSPLVARFAACMALGFMLALMIGQHEGTQQDFGLAFREAVLGPRIFLFLLIGVFVFIAITFWPTIRPLFGRSGFRPLAVGAATVAVSQTLLKWTDAPAVGDGKFSTVASAAGQTASLAPLARTFFGNNVPWIVFVVVVGLTAAGIIVTNRNLAWAGTVLAVVAAVWVYVSHQAVASLLRTPDHSTGALIAALGYLTVAASGAAFALAHDDTADTRAFINRVFGWRPGMPLVVLGVVLGLVGLLAATWFSPGNRNATMLDTSAIFGGTGLAPLASAYLSWLGYVLLVVTAGLSGYAAYSRDTRLGWGAAGLGILSLILTLLTLYSFSKLAAGSSFDGATGPWQNLGTGGWFAAAAFSLLAGAGFVVATIQGELKRSARVGSDVVGTGLVKVPGMGRALLILVITGALFYPPMANQFWQTVLVSEIGIYVLLAIGLNVVVGWAGLLDLGFIAFYAIGSYTTAYLVGALPLTPPSWLQLPPLLAIPFAIVICLVAGVLLGAPTLRLRGDYLAIVTLGFGEIIRIIAINNPGNLTNGPRGAFGIDKPSIKLGPINIEWGSASLQYWYLLLVLIGITVLVFNRLEQSRIGRAWAAVREDEVAAQATGIDTTRIKLLAFAIGASTSGVAGVFFASQIGYINPDNFLLNNSILVVAYVVFGGMGSLPGAMAGAAVLTWLPEFLKDQVPAEDRQMWIGAVILLMMIFRPAGLIPARRRATELHGLTGIPRGEPSAVAAGEGLGGSR